MAVSDTENHAFHTWLLMLHSGLTTKARPTGENSTVPPIGISHMWNYPIISQKDVPCLQHSGSGGSGRKPDYSNQ